MKINKQNLRFFKNLIDFNHFIIKVHEFVRQQFLQYENKSSHSLEHTIRVANLCLELGIQLDAALDVVLTAALFHDVGRPIEELTGRCHAEISAEIAREFLERELRSELISDVSNAISSHRFSKKIEATTKESRILKDADAIDALGAAGIYRTISYSAEKGLNLEEARKHFDAKLLKLPSLMHFPITKEIAERECEILLKFVKELDIGIYHSKFELFLDKLVRKNYSRKAESYIR